MTKNTSLSLPKLFLALTFIATQSSSFAIEESGDIPQAAASVPCTLKPSVVTELSQMDSPTFSNVVFIILSVTRHTGHPLSSLQPVLTVLLHERYGQLIEHLETLSPKEFSSYARHLLYLGSLTAPESPANPLKTEVQTAVSRRWGLLIENLNTLSPKEFPSHAQELCHLTHSAEDNALKTQVKDLVSARSSQLTQYLETLSLQEFLFYAKKLSDLTFALKDNPGDTTSPLETRFKGLASVRWEGLFDHLTKLSLEEFAPYAATLFRLTPYDASSLAALVLYLDRLNKIRAQIALKWDDLQKDLFEERDSTFWKSASAYLNFVRSDPHLISIKKRVKGFPPLPRWHAQTESELVKSLSERLREFIGHVSDIPLAELPSCYPVIELLRGIEETPGPLTQGFVDAMKARLLS